MTDDTTEAAQLQRWTEQHALLMTLAIGGALLDHSPLLVAAIAGGSFLGLVLRFRGHWTPSGRFGAGNLFTSARLAAVFALLLWPLPEGWWTAGLALAILCADGLDGWAARRWDSASEFGHRFDQEADAFFFLALCVVLDVQSQLGGWILLPGALRYLFVLYAKLAKPPCGSFRGNHFTRAVAVFAILACIAGLLPALGSLRLELAVTATLALCGSFLYSAWRLYRPVAGA